MRIYGVSWDVDCAAMLWCDAVQCTSNQPAGSGLKVPPIGFRAMAPWPTGLGLLFFGDIFCQRDGSEAIIIKKKDA